MNNATFSAVVAEYNFTEAGEISLVNDQLRFSLSMDGKEFGWVYLWVECTDIQYCVVYVGMAGKTLKARCGQHQNGFIRSITGTSHSRRLRAGLDAGKRYKLFARKSEIREVLGESAISMVCAEELAFIRKFRPLWNGGA